MLDLVRMCVEYLQIRAQDSADPQRLAGLERLFAEPEATGRVLSKRTHSRVEMELGVDLVVEGASLRGRLLDISGGGMRVAVDGPVDTPARAVLVVRDDERGREYHFLCEVMWNQEGEMGLRYADVPIERVLGGGSRPSRSERG